MPFCLEEKMKELQDNVVEGEDAQIVNFCEIPLNHGDESYMADEQAINSSDQVIIEDARNCNNIDNLQID